MGTGIAVGDFILYIRCVQAASKREAFESFNVHVAFALYEYIYIATEEPALRENVRCYI